jgi:hypothetical protein
MNQNPNDSPTNMIDDLIISYLITAYKSDSFENIDVSKINNSIDRSLYYLILKDKTNHMQIEFEFLEEKNNFQFDCNICYESFQNIDKVLMNCKHYMCKMCAKTYFKHKNNCPFCREKINLLVYLKKLT